MLYLVEPSTDAQAPLKLQDIPQSCIFCSTKIIFETVLRVHTAKPSANSEPNGPELTRYQPER